MSETIEARWESQNEAGRKLFSQGDFAGAEQAFIAAIREATHLGADNVRLASSLSNLGQLKYKQKDLPQAEALFRRALSIRERVLGPEHFGLVQNINNLAALHYARGELEQAEPLFLRALAISEKHLGEGHPEVAVTLNNLARLYFRRADYTAAAPLLTRLLTIKQESLGASHPEVATILTSLAKVRLAEGQYDAGEQLARRALGVREKIHVPNDPAIATALETLAEICGARGKHDEEMQLRERALGIREGTMGADHPSVAAARAAIAMRRAQMEQTQTGEFSAELPKLETLPAITGIAKGENEGPSLDPARTTVERSIIRRDEVSGPRPSRPDSGVGIAASATTSPVAASPSGTDADIRIEVPPVGGSRAVASGEKSVAPHAEPRQAKVATGTLDRPPRGPEPNTGPMRRPGSAAEVPPPVATTRSTSLNWIEPPSSPSLKTKKPTPPVAAPKAPAPPPWHSGDVPGVPAAADGAHAGSGSSTPQFSDKYAQLLGTPTGAQGTVSKGRAHAHEERREISLDWPLEQRRPWLKIAAAILIASAIGFGGWLYLSGRAFSTANGDAAPASATKAAGHGALNAQTTAPASKPAVPVAPPKPAPTETATPSSAGAGAAPAPPPAKPQAQPVKPAPQGAAAKPQTHEAPPTESEEQSSVPKVAPPTIPNVKVEAITTAIEDSARARMDSMGRTIQVKPMTFGKQPPKGGTP